MSGLPCPPASDYPSDPDEKLVLADELEEGGESWELVAWLRLHATGTVRTQSTPYGELYVGGDIVGFDWRGFHTDPSKFATWNVVEWTHPNSGARIAIEWLVEKAMGER